MLRRQDPLANPEPLIRRVYSYAAYRLGDGPDAQDATSDILERAVRYKDSYDPRAGTPQAWLLGIARRVVGGCVARGPRPESIDVAGLSIPPQIDPSAASIERVTLADALAILSQEERDLVALRYGADLLVRDIADVMNARPNAVEVALHRVLAKLRHHLSSSLHPADRA